MWRFSRSSLSRVGSHPQSAKKWELNVEFFTALSQWTLDHPDSTLDHVLRRVSDAIDRGKDYLDLIPNTPFPAQSLIKSVAQLIQLSAKISLARQEVRNFALKILDWVNRVGESLAKARNGRFTQRTKENLVSMRDLIDKICNWAAERLMDGRWSISNAKIEGEIRDFQARLDEAEKLFKIFSSQYLLIIVLENLQKTQEEHFKRIIREQERRRFLEEELRAYTIQDPTYVTQNRHPCDPNTRMEILDEIRAWIDDLSKDTSKNFLWLVGPPGCGKSAIAASIASECKSRNILGAQFFINRNDSNTTNPIKYFPTVSREIAKQSESVEQHLHDALKGRSFSVDTPQQAAELFAYTIGKAAINNLDTPIVVIFDGLDETHRERLEDTATVFSHLFSRLPDYPNAKILISSRPEDEILRSFRTTTHERHVRELVIDIADSNSRRDVKIYLERRLTEIAKKRSLSSAVWPGDTRLEKLVERASGLFIWAVTASNYIDMRLRLRGREVLNNVLDQFDNKAMTEINTLYRTILDFAYPEPFSDEWTLETFRRLVGMIMVLREPKKICDLTSLLDLRETPESEPVDVKNFVEHLRTLLVTNVDEITEETIPQVHKSFFDFITSIGDHIPERFRVDIEASNAEMAFLCFRHLTAAYSRVSDTQYASTKSDLKALSSPAIYSLRFGLSHMPQLPNATLRVISVSHSDAGGLSHLDDLLCRSSHPNHAGPLVFSVPSDNAFFRTSFDGHSLIWNPEDGLAITPISVPLGRETLLFSSGGTRIFRPEGEGIKCMQRDSYDLGKSSSVIKASPDWSMLEFSFDGTKIVFGHEDGRLSLHNTDPYAALLELPKRHKGKIKRLAISRNWSYIASTSESPFIHVWDINGGHYINEPNSMEHESVVECMAFSPNETLLISCDNRRAYIWDVPACNPRKHLFVFHPGGRRSVAFSPDSQSVLAGTREGTVYLWNPHTGEQIGDPWKVPHRERGGIMMVSIVAFRSCGKIALACCDDSVYVWNVCQGTPIMVIPDTYSAVFTPDGSQLLYASWFTFGIRNLAPVLLNSISSFKPYWTSLSPRGNLVLSVAPDEILCWRLDAVKVVGNLLKGGATSVTVAAFSIDESRIAGAAEDGTVYLWDSNTGELLSSLHDRVHGVLSLSFSPDGNQIVVMLGNNQLVVLSIVDGVLSVPSGHERTRALQQVEVAPKSAFFDIDESPMTFGADAAAPNRRLKDVRWYRSKSDSVVWAYVNNHIIRAGKDGSFVVIPGA
ncbi:hypothetical protein C0995_010199 [Termitomyces sp. Mi166|nr:hypothetical protein C0995_010199 [Termitomyces sp. Mi166\